MTENISYRSRVYIWETVVGGSEDESLLQRPSSVGHSSLGIFKKNEEGSEVSSAYLSLRPKYPVSVNPLTVLFPVPSRNFTSLKEDFTHEGRLPDRTYEKHLNPKQFSQLSAEIQNQQNSFTKNKTWYQLMPKMSIFNPIRALTHIELPISSHCALAVRTALLSTGVLIPLTPFPWKITPKELGNSLESVGFQETPSSSTL